MQPYKRPEKELDPDKLPGQIVNRPDYPAAVSDNKPGLYLRDVIARMQRAEEEFSPHGTVNS
jgi:hypothetical protein